MWSWIVTVDAAHGGGGVVGAALAAGGGTQRAPRTPTVPAPRSPLPATPPSQPPAFVSPSPALVAHLDQAMQDGLCGSRDAQAAAARVLDLFWHVCDAPDAALSLRAAEKLAATLADGRRHNFTVVHEVWGKEVCVSVNTWPGSFAEAAPTLRGRFMRDFQKVVEYTKQMSMPVAALSLDIFAELSSSPPSIDVAVTYFPLQPDALPKDLQFVLAHWELLNDAERQTARGS
jgi:hypothetical protein